MNSGHRNRDDTIGRPWLAVFVAIACSPAIVTPALAQQKLQIQIGNIANPNNTESELDFSVGLFVADREHLVNLSRAKDLVDNREYSEAITLLHSILQNDEEQALVADKDRTMLRNLRLEAERVIGELPPSAIETYDRFYDPDARLMLHSAIDDFDLDQLAATSRRYFYTSAGGEATYLLATAFLDQGRPMDAAVWFERLRTHHPPTKSGRDVLALQTAMAWALADVPTMAKTRLSELKDLVANNRITLGGQVIKIFDRDDQSLDWLFESVLRSKNETPEPEQEKPTVNSAFLSQVAWKISTSSWQVPIEEAPFSGGIVDVSRQLAGITAEFRKKQLAAIPSVRPLIVDDVALVRTQSQIQAFDLASGELLWKSNGENVLEQVRCGTVPPLPGDTGSILDPMLKDRLFVNASYGAMTTDNGLAFCLDDLGFHVQAAVNNGRTNIRNKTNHPLGTKSHNRLVAYDVNKGRIKWSVGGEAGPDKLKLDGHFFLGAPLPLAGHLYCLAEAKQQVQLLVLDANTGKLDWSKPLQTVGVDVTQDEHRSRAGLCPSYSKGVLVCPTGSGLVVGVDLATRQLMWSYRYRELDDGSPQDLARRVMMMRIAAARGNPVTTEVKKGDWHAATPLVVGDHVVVTPRDCQDLLCLRLSNGELVWKKSKGDYELVAGKMDDNLVMIGSNIVEMLRARDGQPVWKEPVKIESPSGRGILDGKNLIVPISSGGLATIDLVKGKVVSTDKSEDSEFFPGNLVTQNGFIISQGPAGVVCFKQSASSE